jgi:hypothetical protein
MTPSNYPAKALVSLLALFSISFCSGRERDIRSSTFAKLTAVRQERKAQVTQKLEKMMSKVRAAAADPVLSRAFANFKAMAASGKPGGRAGDLEDRELDRAYLEEYYYFYDILFVAPDGLVFYTIRRESDLGQNLFTGGLSSTLLAQKLKGGGAVEFVDYHYYSPSQEPAAFFVATVAGEGKPAGWMVFQFSSGALMEIMSAETGLGKTAEVYLTNENKVMLTQSRLLPRGAPLSLRVETEAVERAMRVGEGSGVIKDYRGMRVFSSFQKFGFAGADWVIIAEVDEEEVITQRFMENRDYYYREIFTRLPAGPPAEPKPQWLSHESVKVDINEYASGGRGDIIATAGVTTCTAVALQYPGKFAFVGHIYPLDLVYFGRWEKPLVDVYYRLADGVHGDGVTDLMGNMIHEIQYFRIYPSQTRALEAVLIATHQKSFARITDRLLDSGFYLSQIRILSLPGMKYVDVAAEVDSGAVVAHWADPGKTRRWTTSIGAPTMESLVKQVMNYDDASGAGQTSPASGREM